MTEKQLTINYKQFDRVEEMDEPDRLLIEKAIEAQAGSYSPYSHFSVGAALRLEDGSIIKGSNQENNAYPAGLCAERTAMFAAGANFPDKAFDTIAIVASHHGQMCEDPATPCGECRQVMAEYQNKNRKPFKVILVGSKKILKFEKVDDILPFIFDSLKA